MVFKTKEETKQEGGNCKWKHATSVHVEYVENSDGDIKEAPIMLVLKEGGLKH